MTRRTAAQVTASSRRRGDGRTRMLAMTMPSKTTGRGGWGAFKSSGADGGSARRAGARARVALSRTGYRIATRGELAWRPRTKGRKVTTIETVFKWIKVPTGKVRRSR